MADTQTKDAIYELAKRFDDPEAIRSWPEILRHLVTEAEAEILLGLPIGRLGTVTEVQNNTGAALADVEAALNKGYRIGMLAYRAQEDGERGYGYVDIYVDTICGDARNNVHGQRYRNLWVQWTKEQIERREATNGPGILEAGRILPIPEVFHEHEHNVIISYEDAREIIKNSRARAVGQCPCKFHNEGCTYPMDEICLFLDHMAERQIERGSHRELTKEEALTVLQRTAEAGLVHMSTEHHYMAASAGTEFICSCCGCCCAFFEYHFKHPEKGAIVSNYTCEVDEEKCVGCGKCVERCFVNATSVVNGVNVIDRDKCLGCGVCAYVCEHGAKVLKRKQGDPAPHPQWERHFIEPRLSPEPEPEA